MPRHVWPPPLRLAPPVDVTAWIRRDGGPVAGLFSRFERGDAQGSGASVPDEFRSAEANDGRLRRTEPVARRGRGRRDAGNPARDPTGRTTTGCRYRVTEGAGVRRYAAGSYGSVRRGVIRWTAGSRLSLGDRHRPCAPSFVIGPSEIQDVWTVCESDTQDTRRQVPRFPGDRGDGFRSPNPCRSARTLRRGGRTGSSVAKSDVRPLPVRRPALPLRGLRRTIAGGSSEAITTPAAEAPNH